MARSQPARSDEQPPGRGSTPQLSLVNAPPEVPDDAVWFTACAWCGRIEERGRWIDAPAAPELIGDREPLLTHGICPTCFGEVSPVDRTGES